MPIVLDQEQNKSWIPVSLPLDADKPVETRPAFDCRFLTAKQVSAFRKKLLAITQATDEEAVNAQVNELLAIPIVQVRSFPSSDLATVLDDCLSMEEKWDLVGLIPAAIIAAEVALMRPSAEATAAQAV